jgi:hypothetical protein
MLEPQGGESRALVQLPSMARNNISFQTYDSWPSVDEKCRKNNVNVYNIVYIFSFIG